LLPVITNYRNIVLLNISSIVVPAALTPEKKMRSLLIISSILQMIIRMNYNEFENFIFVIVSISIVVTFYRFVIPKKSLTCT